MNILFVTDVSAGKVTSGSERVLFEQSTRLQKKGHNVHILTRKLPEHNSDQEVIQGVREWRYDIDPSNSLSFIRSTLSNCKDLFENLEKKYSFDCVNFHQPFSAYAVMHSPEIRKVRKVYTCHSLSFEEFRSRNPRPEFDLRRIIYCLNIQARKYIERKILNESDSIVVLSRFTQGKLWDAYRIPPEKVLIIPGGVDLEKFFPAIDKPEIRRRLSIPDGKIILLTVRDLEPRMGLENLVYAMKSVIQVMPDIYLVIGGRGPLKNDLVSLSRRLGIEDYIGFAGFIPEKELPDYYRMSDIFILPTKELEGFGLITLEAMASGVPVLGTPVGGTKEILGQFNRDFLFTDTEPDSMADLIIEKCRKILEDPGYWQRISDQCRKFVENNYSWDKNVDLLEKLFTTCLKRGEL